MIALFLLLCIFYADAGQYYSHLQNGKRAYVQHQSNEHSRTGRNAGRGRSSIFTEFMDFDVTLESGEIISLHVELNKHQIGKVLVKVFTDTGTEFFDSTKQKDYRFYQVVGEDHGAAVMVRCENFKSPCYIAGSFYHNNIEYLIDPDVNIAQTVSRVPHTVYIVPPSGHTRSFHHDIIKAVTDDEVTTRANSETQRSHLLSIFSQLSKQFKQQRSKQQKYKRETIHKHYKIELEMLIADDIYDFWLSRMSNNRDAALEKIEEYFEQIANMMDLRFSTASTPTMTIDIVPLIITVLQDKSKANWITENVVHIADDGDEAYNADKALRDLYSWAKINRYQNADALVCFSRRDMWGNGQRTWNQTVGIARFPLNRERQPISGLCSVNAVSLNEVFRSGDASASTTHELAHNMGVNHDSSYNDTSCPDDEMYIMAGTLGFVGKVEDADHPWQFSNCSVSVMERLMSSIPKNDGKTCLERDSYDINEYNTILKSPHLGEIYSLDEQCEFLNGKGSRSCKSKKITEDQLCWKGLLCYSKDGRYCEYKNPLPGSSCGGTKKCYKGQCVDNIPTPVTENPALVTASPSNSTSVSSSFSNESTSVKISSQSSLSSTPTNKILLSSSTVSTPTLTTSSSVSTSSTTMSTHPSTSSTTVSTHTSTSSTTVSIKSANISTSSSSALSSSSKSANISTSTPKTVITTTLTTPSTEATYYTKGEYEWLYYFYSNCLSSCYCWRSYCWIYKQRSLCRRFASVCYE